MEKENIIETREDCPSDSLPAYQKGSVVSVTSPPGPSDVTAFHGARRRSVSAASGKISNCRPKVHGCRPKRHGAAISGHCSAHLAILKPAAGAIYTLERHVELVVRGGRRSIDVSRSRPLSLGVCSLPLEVGTLPLDGSRIGARNDK